jgi:UDPglucose 6-dehydrogenase
MIYFYGTSHAAQHLRSAAEQKGVKVVDAPSAAEVLFVSEDTPTDMEGKRDLRPVIAYLVEARQLNKPIVLTSQVPPGFTRALGYPQIYHQAETLRIKDAMERALEPEQIIVGAPTYQSYALFPKAYRDYLEAFDCPVRIMRWEDAEFSKIAINMFLAAQVDTTNRLAAAAKLVDAHWWHVAEVLKLDKRIGPHAYLEPGRWQDSLHLLRDHYTLESILAR